MKHPDVERALHRFLQGQEVPERPLCLLPRDWGLDLAEYVEKLLRAGKRADHEDFQVLMRIFPRQKIIDLAKGIKQRIKEQENDSDDTENHP